jgi:hypothetical protein
MRAVQYAGPAYRFAASEAALLASFAMLPILLLGLFGAFTAAPVAERTGFALIENLLRALATAWFLKPIYVGLLEGRAPAMQELWQFDPPMKALLLNSALLVCATDLPVLISIQGMMGGSNGTNAGSSPELSGMGLTALVVVPVTVYLSVRLALVQLLAVARGQGITFGEAWRLSQGRFWFLVRLYILCLGPAILLFMLLDLVLGGSSARASMLGSAFASVVDAIPHLAGQAICAHALVGVYRDLTATTGAAPRSIPGGPEA